MVTNTKLEHSSSAWMSWVNLILGLWLIIAPFFLGYTSQSTLINDIIVGVAVVAFASSALKTKQTSSSWWNVALGVWLFISPSFLANGVQASRSNDIIVGILVAAMGLGAAYANRWTPHNTGFIQQH